MTASVCAIKRQSGQRDELEATHAAANFLLALHHSRGRTVQAVKTAMPAAHAPAIHCDLALVQSGSLAVNVLAAPCSMHSGVGRNGHDKPISTACMQLRTRMEVTGKGEGSSKRAR